MTITESNQQRSNSKKKVNGQEEPRLDCYTEPFDIKLDIEPLERNRAERELMISGIPPLPEGMYRLMVENINDVIFILNDEGNMTYISPVIKKVTGYNEYELLGKSFMKYIHPEDLPGLLAGMKRCFAGEFEPFEFRVFNKDGNVQYVRTSSRLYKENNKSRCLIGMLTDITERKQYEEKLKYLSLHDSLTGLFNRAYFELEMKRLENNYIYPAGIIICDIDGLKFQNDSLGHKAGDFLLIATSRLIKKCFRGSDVVARIGGDEFAVLLPNTPDLMVEEASNRIRQAVIEYNSTNPVTPLSLSVGWATRNDSTKTMTKVFVEADNEMYREKKKNREKIQDFLLSLPQNNKNDDKK
ncbi:MAG TPA: diguanylate cyclase [Clostridia bacterium]|nr:diguanylate cyclase [Syntrophomonadaceae bacterium]HHV70985.1 diguanylate cyclase [Clostridia bacterium]